jgi:hypothetical protein
VVQIRECRTEQCSTACLSIGRQNWGGRTVSARHLWPSLWGCTHRRRPKGTGQRGPALKPVETLGRSVRRPRHCDAIAPYRGGKPTDVEAEAVLEHLKRTGLVVVQRVKIPRAGGRFDERDGLVVTAQGKTAMQDPQQTPAIGVPPPSPQQSCGNDAGCRTAGRPSDPATSQGGVGGDAGDGTAGTSAVPPQPTASVDCNERAAEPPARTRNAPVDSAQANGAAPKAEVAASLLPESQERRGDRLDGPAPSNNLTIRPRPNRKQSP